MLKFENIIDKSDFKNLEEEWDNLLDTTESKSIFLTYNWFNCCIESFANNKEINVGIIRDDKQLVGILPLWLNQDVYRGISIKQLEIIRCPDSPFVDLIIHPDFRRAVIELFLDKFLLLQKKWDLFTLDSVPQESPNLSIIKDILREKGVKSFPKLSSVMPYIPISDSWEEFLKSKSSKFRKTRRNIMNRIQRLEKVDLSYYSREVHPDISEDLIQLSKKSWKHREGIALSSRPEVMNFFSDLTSVAAKLGWLHLWILRLEGNPIAMEYDLMDGDKIYALRADFDESYKEFSPGSFLEYHIIEDAFEKKFQEYNTGPGIREYKMHWTNSVRENGGLSICNANYKGKSLWLLERKGIPIAKGILRKLLKK
jgi:CelD/BcsL family acetyltransferase involved in cellulose biosynthesis